MYRPENYSFDYFSVPDISQLENHHKMLVLKAREACGLAYAPYSKFHVGAALLLANHQVVTASNKENASFSAGICAERNALNYASDLFPGEKILALAIEAIPQEFQLKKPVSPCGICRQVMCETERNQEHDFEVILSAGEGPLYVFKRAQDLLPFQFYLRELRN